MLYIPWPFKRCPMCGNDLPATSEYFPRQQRQKDGLRSECKECAKARVAKWRNEHPGRENATVAKYYRKHTEQKKAYAARYYLEHSEQVKARATKYQHEHPEMVNAKSHRRRALTYKAEGTHNGQDILAQLKRQKKRCYYCGEKLNGVYHVDHVVPLSRGGGNGPDNLVIACPTCNMHKHDKLPHEWIKGGRLL